MKKTSKFLMTGALAAIMAVGVAVPVASASATSTPSNAENHCDKTAEAGECNFTLDSWSSMSCTWTCDTHIESEVKGEFTIEHTHGTDCEYCGMVYGPDKLLRCECEDADQEDNELFYVSGDYTKDNFVSVSCYYESGKLLQPTTPKKVSDFGETPRVGRTYHRREDNKYYLCTSNSAPLGQWAVTADDFGEDDLSLAYYTDGSFYFGCEEWTECSIVVNAEELTETSYMVGGDLKEFDLSVDLDGCGRVKDCSLRAYYSCTDSGYMGKKLYAVNVVTTEEKVTFSEDLDITANNIFYDFAGSTIEGLENLDTTNLTNLQGMFTCCSNLEQVDVSGFNTEKVTDMSWLFNNCEKLTELDVSTFDTSNVTNMEGMFDSCEGITELDVSTFDTSKVTNMSSMFENCASLTEIDVSTFDTSNVEDMSWMFSSCEGITELDLSDFDTANVTDMSYMFSYCDGITELDLSDFDTANVTDMSYMFSYNPTLETVDLSSFDTSNVTDMSNMFYYCEAMEAIDLSNFDTSNVEDMSYMFYSCLNLTELTLGENFVLPDEDGFEEFYDKKEEENPEEAYYPVTDMFGMVARDAEFKCLEFTIIDAPEDTQSMIEDYQEMMGYGDMEVDGETVSQIVFTSSDDSGNNNNGNNGDNGGHCTINIRKCITIVVNAFKALCISIVAVLNTLYWIGRIWG